MILQDAHNHLADPRLKNDLVSILKEFEKFQDYSCIVNGTSPKDWSMVQDLTEHHPDIFHAAYGLHPWYVNEYHHSDWAIRLKNIIIENSNAGIGECGLDKWVKNHQIKIQQKVFETHLEFAKTYQRSVFIHCLKAWDLLVSILKNAQLQARTFLIHAFSGSKQTADQLIQLGAMFSFSGYFLHSRKAKTLQLYQELPLENILIETDSPSMALPEQLRKHQLVDDSKGVRSHPANIEITLHSFIKARRESEDEIMQALQNNYNSLLRLNS